MIVITGHGDVPLAVRAMKAGALDFIEKPFATRQSSTASKGFGGIAQSRTKIRGSRLYHAATLLSPREREVLEGLLAGLPNKTIAYDLAISPRTVEIPARGSWKDGGA